MFQETELTESYRAKVARDVPLLRRLAYHPLAGHVARLDCVFWGLRGLVGLDVRRCRWRGYDQFVAHLARIDRMMEPQRGRIAREALRLTPDSRSAFRWRGVPFVGP